MLTFDHFWINADGLDCVEISLIDVLSDDLKQLFVTFKLNVFYLHLVHFIDDSHVVWGQHLCAVFPISLVSIVLFWVVTGCNVHTSLATKMPDGKRTLGCRSHVVEQIYLDAIGREDIGNTFGEFTTVVAAIMAHDNGYVVTILEVFLQVIGKSLGSHAHRVDVHTVASGTHDTTKSTCSKL